MERTIHFTLVDQVSTLNRITSAFVRLQCNIDELHVKHSDKEGISNMKLKVNIKDDDTFKIVLKKLSQQVNVLSVLKNQLNITNIMHLLRINYFENSELSIK
ncbi:MAG: ACT domain-containing protein [Staphylococcus epidermidis]|nr:ACT domain-containing protein [Staphylococcus epidermidis]